MLEASAKWRVERGAGSVELPLPIIHLPAQFPAFQILSLPRRVIGVLDLQRRQLARAGLWIERGHLPGKYAHGPSIANGVMHGDKQHVFFDAEPHSLDTKQRSRAKREWTPCLCIRQARELTLAVARGK